MAAVKIEPARYGMTGKGIGSPVRVTHFIDEEHGGPLDAPCYIAMGGVAAGKSDPNYLSTTVLRPGAFEVARVDAEVAA